MTFTPRRVFSSLAIVLFTTATLCLAIALGMHFGFVHLQVSFTEPEPEPESAAVVDDVGVAGGLAFGLAHDDQALASQVSAAQAAWVNAMQAVNASDSVGSAEGQMMEAKNRYRRLFLMVDQDHDGFLSSAEFTVYYTLLRENDGDFDMMDIDKDSIISFREIVATLKAFDGLYDEENSALNVISQLAFTVQLEYHYNYTRDDDLWYEYAADTYFEEFDDHYRGYISRADYFGNMAENEFEAYDVDQNGVLNMDEFLDMAFSESIIATTIARANEMQNRQARLQSAGSTMLHLTDDDLAGISLQMCPNVIQPIDLRAMLRRLLSTSCLMCIGMIGTCAVAALAAALCCYFSALTYCWPCVRLAGAVCGITLPIAVPACISCLS
jgi:Ca2+-binding EF-hand superfamily protein